MQIRVDTELCMNNPHDAVQKLVFSMFKKRNEYLKTYVDKPVFLKRKGNLVEVTFRSANLETFKYLEKGQPGKASLSNLVLEK
jgi:hypothetical protein